MQFSGAMVGGFRLSFFLFFLTLLDLRPVLAATVLERSIKGRLGGDSDIWLKNACLNPLMNAGHNRALAEIGQPRRSAGGPEP
jgi:hypothetical protein